MACHITLLPQDCHKRETMGWGWQVLGKPLPLPLREKNLPGRPEKEQKWGGGALEVTGYQGRLGAQPRGGGFLPAWAGAGKGEEGEEGEGGIPACASRCSSHRTSRSTV